MKKKDKIKFIISYLYIQFIFREILKKIKKSFPEIIATLSIQKFILIRQDIKWNIW